MRCARCGGSGQERRVVNPDWPKGECPHKELTDEDCRRCIGRGTELTWEDFTEIQEVDYGQGPRYEVYTGNHPNKQSMAGNGVHLVSWSEARQVAEILGNQRALDWQADWPEED